METILFTKGNDLIVRTVYIAEQNIFATVYEYPSGEMQVVDTYNSVMSLIENHDFWCKFSGVISTTITGSQVEKHLTSCNLRAS